MEQRRLELDFLLRELLGDEGTTYYSPPNGTELNYPCIVYKLSGIDSDYADNISYLTFLHWQLTLIDEDPDSKFVDKILGLPMVNFSTFFAKDGLNHFVFGLYF